MSLFSKIKNVIQKEQHKYTAPSMSSSLLPDSFALTELAQYGLPSIVSTLAYDPVQSLLAVGTFQGTILLFGKPGITAHLSLPESAAILFLAFQVGEPRLVTVDSHQNLVVFNLDSFEPSFTYKLNSPTSCINLLPGTEYLLLGLRTGRIEMYNISRGFRSGYTVETSQILPDNNEAIQLRVITLQAHPIDSNQLLIGYSSGLIVLWDLRSRRVIKYYQYQGPSSLAPKFWHFKENDPSGHYTGHLTVVTWRPDGTQFLSGYDDGTIVFWDVKSEKKPLLARTISDPDLSVNQEENGKAPSRSAPSKREPIFKVLWCSVTDSEDTYIAVAGGSLNQDLRGIRIFDYHTRDYRAPRRLRMLTVSEDLADFFVFPKESPWFNGARDPATIAIIIPSGAVRLYEFNAGFSTCSVPPELQWLDPRIATAKLITNCPDYLYKNLVFGYQQPMSYGGVVKGGIQVCSDSGNTKKLMLTIHQDGSLRIWRCTESTLILLKHITFIPGSIHPTISKSRISFVDPCFENGQMVIGFNSGHVLQYWFKMNEDETSNFHYAGEDSPIHRDNLSNRQYMEQPALPLRKATTIASHGYTTDPAISPQNRLRSSSQPVPGTSKEASLEPQVLDVPPRTTSLSVESHVADANEHELNTPSSDTQVNIMKGQLHSEPQINDTMSEERQTSTSVPTNPFLDEEESSPKNSPPSTTPHSSPKCGSEPIHPAASIDERLEDTSARLSSQKNSQTTHASESTNEKDPAVGQAESIRSNNTLPQQPSDPSDDALPIQPNGTDDCGSHKSLVDATNDNTTLPNTPSKHSMSENSEDQGFTGLLKLSPNYLNTGSYPLVPSLLIRCHQGTVNNVVSTEIGLLALSDEEGTLSIVDTIGQKLVFYQDYSDQSQLMETDVSTEAYSINSVAVDRITAMMFVESFTQETDQPGIKLVTGSFRGVFRVFNVHLNDDIYTVSEDVVFRTKDKSPAIYVNVVNMKGLPQRPSKYKQREDSIEDLEHAQSDGSKHKQKVESHYFICCTEESIMIHLNCSATRLHKSIIQKEDGKIIKASISRYQDQSCFVVLTSTGLIKIFTLPKLAHIIDIPISNYIPERLKDSVITDDGRILVSTAQYQFREYSFFKENSFINLVPKVCRLYNKAKKAPEKPTLNSTWWFGGNESASSSEINELLGQGFLDRKAKQREQTQSNRTQDEIQSTSSVLADAGRMLNERGEKLSRLQDTVANMEASSAGFLADIQEYNKRMAAKKWYQL